MLSQNRLAELPKTLELEIPAKLYFPHKYNKNENFGVRRDILPPFEDYCPGTMKDADYEKFEKWYRENQETKFELGGFEKADNQSKIAIKYFEWLAFRDGVKVRHACNGGEIEFGGYKVDCVIGEQKKIIEFQECDVKAELKKNKGMKNFFDNVVDKG
uniref:DNA-directed DNA polymerase n=1 Tax=Globodera pallida TaxID=36090 RepID=A0A183C791_GLOPA